MRKYPFSQRVINEWNKVPNDCVNASSVNMNIIISVTSSLVIAPSCAAVVFFVFADFVFDLISSFFASLGVDCNLNCNSYSFLKRLFFNMFSTFLSLSALN